MRRKLAGVIVSIAVSIGTVGLPATGAGAFDEEVECTGPLGPGTYPHVVVPSGATCDLSDSVVSGNVRVLPGGTLFLETTQVGGNVVGHDVTRVLIGRSTVDGNIVVIGGEAPFGGTVLLCATSVSGNVIVQQVTGGIGVRTYIPGFDFPAGFAARCGAASNEIAGNLVVSNNNSIRILVHDNLVEHNLLAVNNSGPGPKVFRDNRVGHVLVCLKNEELFTAHGNTAEKAKAQCSNGT